MRTVRDPRMESVPLQASGATIARYHLRKQIIEGVLYYFFFCRVIKGLLQKCGRSLATLDHPCEHAAQRSIQQCRLHPRPRAAIPAYR